MNTLSDAASPATPFDDVRDLALRKVEHDPAPAESVRQALLGMGREGDFGRLGEAAEWLAYWQGRFPPRIENATLALFAGSHGISSKEITLSSDDSTRSKVEALREGKAPLSAIAAQVGVNIRVFELALDKPTADFLLHSLPALLRYIPCS